MLLGGQKFRAQRMQINFTSVICTKKSDLLDDAQGSPLCSFEQKCVITCWALLAYQITYVFEGSFPYVLQYDCTKYFEYTQIGILILNYFNF